MPLYMTQFTYTADAWAALANDPHNRGDVFRSLVQGLGGRLVGFYYSFGEYDGVAIYEAPDDTTAAAIIMAALAPGHNKAIKTTKLLTVEETLAALNKAGGVPYYSPQQYSGPPAPG